MVKTLSKKQIKIINHKLAGKTNVEIAKIEYPNSKPKSGESIVSVVLNRPQVKEYLNISRYAALQAHNINWSRLIFELAEMLDSKDFRLKQFAIRSLIPLLDDTVSKPINDNDKLYKALKNTNEVELQRIVFNKTSSNTEVKNNLTAQEL